MSLTSKALPWLTIKPNIQGDDNRLTIKTSFFESLIYLFSHSKKVVVNKPIQSVTIKSRSYWLKKQEKRIRFKEIECIDYKYESIPTGFTWTLEGPASSDAVERYVIDLVTKEESITICSFKGEGARLTGWIGTLAGDDLIDYEGTQRDDSRTLVERLAKFINRPIGKKTDFIEMGEMKTCTRCCHKYAHILTKCMYCGYEEDSKQLRM